MKRVLKNFRRGLMVLVFMVPMIAGIILLDISNSKNEIAAVRSNAGFEREAFNGRDSNWIDGTGFDETKASGGIGATLTEPDWSSMDSWDSIYNGKTFWQMFYGMSNEASFTQAKIGTSPFEHDYRYKDVNKPNLSERGKSADNPWIISTVEELAFWSKLISLGTNTYTNMSTANVTAFNNSRFVADGVNFGYPANANNQTYALYAYISAPYFQLAKDGDFDLAGKRWVPPYFTYTSNETINNWANRFYLDGNGATIKNAYVRQSNATGVALPSILGNLPYKSQVKNLNIENAYVTHAEAVCPASIVTQTLGNSSSSWYSTTTSSVFSNINVKNSVVRGGTSATSSGFVNGITGNAAVIKDCTVENTTFLITSPAATGQASSHARGIGTACEFSGNTVKNSSLEIVDPNYSSWSMGIGALVTANPYVKDDTTPEGGSTAEYGGVFSTGEIPLYTTATGNTPVNNGTDDGSTTSGFSVKHLGFRYALNDYKDSTDPTRENVNYWDANAIIDGVPFAFAGGFFDNTVTDSKITVTANGGTTSNYGHATGIGHSNVNTEQSYENNTVENSLISVKTDENSSTSTIYATGIIYASYTGTEELGKNLTITNNAVLNSTINVDSQMAVTNASGISIIESSTINAEITECYTENTNVLSTDKSNTTSTGLESRASGINVGYATSIEDCVVGSGNIVAKSARSIVRAYGIGSTLGHSLSGPTGTSGRQYFKCETQQKYYQHEDDHDINSCGCPDTGYIGDKPQTNIINCINFSNITTGSVGTVYAAGIGMAEGFDGCINYGNVMGNWVGGIALGFEYTTNNQPSIPTSGVLATFTTVNGALRPLIIKNCANFGNLIKVGNEIASRMGGIFAVYNNALNYQRTNIGQGGYSNIQIISEDINGKHVEVTNCVSSGKFFFYVLKDGTYELTNDITQIAAGSLRIGMIFGWLQVTPQPSISFTASDLADFSNRFIIQDNFYVENRFEIGGTTGLQSRITTTTQATRVRKMEPNHVYNTTAANQPDAKEDELTVEYNSSIHTTPNYILNKTSYTYWSQSPDSNLFANVLGVANASGLVNGSSYSTVATTAYEQVYNDIAQTWTNNKSITSKFFGIDYTGSNVATADRWDTTSNIPQRQNSAYPFLILAYDKNNASQGYAPNVSIKKYEGSAIAFNISEFQNPKTGESIEQWFRYNTVVMPGILPNTLNGNAPTPLDRLNSLPIIMLFADANPTVFTITYTPETTATEYNADIINTNDKVTINNAIKIEGVYTPSEAVDVSALIWMVQNQYGVWEEFKTEIFPSEVSLNNGGETPLSIEYSLDFIFDETFVIKFAQGTLGNYSFSIKAVFVTISIRDLTISIPVPNVEGTTNQIRVGLETPQSGPTHNVKIVDGSVVQLEALFDEKLFTFGSFFVKLNDAAEPRDDEHNDFEILSDTGVNSPVITIQVFNNLDISFTLVEREYEIKISMYYLTNNDIRVPLANDAMIESETQHASIANTSRTLTVTDIYEDTSANCYFKFNRWEYTFNAYTSICDTNSFTLIDIQTNVLKESTTREFNGEFMFEIVVIYDRQVELFVNMERAGFEEENYNNSFIVYENYETNPIKTFEASSGNLIVKDNTQLRIEFLPDTLLSIIGVKIDGAPIQLKYVPDDVLIVSINNLCNIQVSLGLRPATINVFTKIEHESTGKEYSMGFITLSGDNPADQNNNDPLIADFNYKISNERTLTVTFDRTKLGNNYRLDKIAIKHSKTNTYYDYSNENLISNNDSFEHLMDSDFFKFFVDKEGYCQIWLFLIATYEVDLTITSKTASDFEREEGTNKYADKIGNWFELEFKGNQNGVRKISDSKFIIDHGVIIEYKYGTGSYSTFDRVSGLNAEQNNAKEVEITSLQSLDFIFLMNQYTLNLTQVGGGKASINRYSETFELNSIITISLDVNSMYKIGSIKFGTYSLSDLGAIKNGNTITIKATPGFIATIGAIIDPDVELTMNVSTSISTMILAGSSGGGALVLLLIALAIFLVIRSKRIAEARKVAEAKVREYEQKFNIGGMIAKLREDPDGYEESMKNPKGKPAASPVPKPVAVVVLDGGTLQKDKTILDKNKKKIGSLQTDGTILDNKGKPFGKINLETGAITDNANNTLGTVQGDGSIKKS